MNPDGAVKAWPGSCEDPQGMNNSGGQDLDASFKCKPCFNSMMLVDLPQLPLLTLRMVIGTGYHCLR